MNIVFFDDRYHQVYGAQENLLLLATLAQRSGHDTRLVTTYEGRLADAARGRGIAVEVIEAPASLRVFERGLLEGGLYRKAVSFARALRYSRTVHRHLRRWGVGVLVAGAIRPCLLLLRSRLARRPHVLLYAQSSVPLGLIGSAALPGVDRICLISEGARGSFPPWVLRVFSSRIRSLPSGRDLGRYFVDTASRSDGSDLRLLTVASINPRKGLHVLIDALAKLRSRGIAATLTVVGDLASEGEKAYFEELVDQVERNKLSVEFAGWQDDVLPYYRKSNAFVLASFHEGLPGVLLEAMAAGLPCVATSAGSSDAVVEGETGYVVAPGDATALADRLALLVDGNRRVDLGSHGQQRVRDYYSTDAFLARFENLLDELPHR